MNQQSTLHHQRVRMQFTKINIEILSFKHKFSLGGNCIFVIRTPLLSLIYKRKDTFMSEDLNYWLDIYVRSWALIRMPETKNEDLRIHLMNSAVVWGRMKPRGSYWLAGTL